MIHAYGDCYCRNAQKILGCTIDYALNGYKLTPGEFTSRFISSGYAWRFGTGDPRVVAGMTGRDLVVKILEHDDSDFEELDLGVSRGTSWQFWAGWALARYQWATARSFEYIFSKVPLHDVIYMYPTFHQMADDHFEEAMEMRIRSDDEETALQRRRKAFGMSQKELSVKSGVNLRMIQLYEQRRSDINRAQVNTLFKLAAVLRCRVDDILDDPMYSGEVYLDESF